jgi:hypothetical protein
MAPVRAAEIQALDVLSKTESSEIFQKAIAGVALIARRAGADGVEVDHRGGRVDRPARGPGNAAELVIGGGLT